jgi:uncharacterized protein (DUF2236 family)
VCSRLRRALSECAQPAARKPSNGARRGWQPRNASSSPRRRTAGDAQRAVDCDAVDPHLLAWVHVAEVDSFWRAHPLYGANPLTPADYDGYVADMARVGSALGVVDPPCDRGELAERIEAYRSELRATPGAEEAARFLLWYPPIPLPARIPYGAFLAWSTADRTGVGSRRRPAGMSPDVALPTRHRWQC